MESCAAAKSMEMEWEKTRKNEQQAAWIADQKGFP